MATLRPIGSPVPFGGLSIERHRLDNGLTLLLVVDRSAPVVSYQTWFSVGSRHERVGKTGIAHLFEHLMFNETEGLPYGEYDKRLEEAGAENNAATYLDWTYYLVNLPAEALPLAVELEAERMHRLVLREPQLESEREVVMNERRQTVEDDVDGAVNELLFGTAFVEHPYRFPTIGTMADIAALTTDDCRAFYRTYYAPNNATLVVVGDVDREALRKAIEERYGALTAADLPVEVTPAEPPQSGERRARVRKPTETAKVAIGYKSPAMSHADHAPLTLLCEILFGGRGSRVHRALVDERELASEAQGMLGNFRDPSLLDIYLTANAGIDPEAMIAALDEILDGVVREPVSEAELGRARARLELATLQGLETAGGKAEHIGFSEVVLGDPAAALTRLSLYASTSREDIHRAAQRWLRRDGRTIVEALPA